MKNIKFAHLFVGMILTAWMVVTTSGNAAAANSLIVVQQLPHFLPVREDAARPKLISPLAPSPTSNMTYHGGEVMNQFHAFTIFWDPNSNMTSAYQNLINRYFQDIGGTPFYNIVTQYCDGIASGAACAGNASANFIQNVSDLGGTWLDTTNAYPHAGTTADPVQDGDLRDEINRAITANSWPSGGTTNMYFVFTEQGIESCFNATSCTPGVPNGQPLAFCAYHFFFDSNKIYANMPFVNSWSGCSAFGTAPNGSTANDAEVSTTSHEHIEAVTDPLSDGWFDSDATGEIGDKCNQLYGTTTINGNNMTAHGNPYILQLEWSNARFNANGTSGSGCASDYQPPSVSIAKSAPATVIAGTDMTYTISVTNNGAPTAETPAISDTLPFGTTFQSIAFPAGWSCTTPVVGSGGPISCTKSNGFMNNAESASISTVVHVSSNVLDGSTINNTGKVDWDTAYRQNPLNATSSQSTQVLTSADLAVSKIATPNPAVAGTNETYLLTVTNNGPSDAQSVTLSDALPSGTSFVALTQNTGPTSFCPASSSGVTCTLAALPAGASATFSFVVHVSPSLPDGSTLTNTLSASSTTSDPNTTNNSSTVVTPVITAADLSMSKSQRSDLLIADIEETYDLTISNNGPSDAQSVSMIDTVPADTTFVSFVQNTGPAFICTTPAVGGTGDVNCSIPTLALGDSMTFTLVVLVDPVNVNSISNTASAQSTTTDPVSDNNSATVTATVSVKSYKAGVLNDLMALRASVTDPQDARKLDDAIQHVSASLEPGLWLDENTLDAGSGDKVFTEEKDAVVKLRDLIDHNSSGISGVSQDWIDRLIAADRALADIAIHQAISAGGKGNQIGIAMNEFTRGKQKIGTGQDNVVIEHFRNAWQHAQLAMKN